MTSKKGMDFGAFNEAVKKPRADVLADVAAADTPAVTRAARTRSGLPAQDVGERVVIGVSLTGAVYDLAKSGFLADLDHAADPADRLRTWFDRAIAEHARRTPAKRTSLLAKADPAEDSRGRRPRRLDLLVRTVAAMDEAIGTEPASSRPTRSEFITGAVRVAADQARRRAGGTLPEAPARLSPWLGRR